MNDTVSGGNHHKSDDAQSSTPVDIPGLCPAHGIIHGWLPPASQAAGCNYVPEELAEARDLQLTAMANTDAAEQAYGAASAEVWAAICRKEVAADALDRAHMAEVDATAKFRDALRKYGYVQTADGPRARDPQ